jgi:hypothetical protein
MRNFVVKTCDFNVPQVTENLKKFYFRDHFKFHIFNLGRVRILIKNRLKVKFDRFTIEKMSNFTFNRVLMSIRTRPKW